MSQNQEKEEEKLLNIPKDSEVEVCSAEPGFVGSWYRAILEEDYYPTKSRRKKLRVRYTTLLQDDSSTPLTETVQQSFIRPVPPEDLYHNVVFAEGSVVDADLKDGWWQGVVVKRLEEEEEDLFLVCFDTPPDVIQFKRNQLRPHFDWTGSEWVPPQNMELSKSLFSCGTTVEVSREINNNLEAAWVPAIVVKEVEGGVIVKSCYKSLTFNADEVTPSFTVDVGKVRPVPPPPQSCVEQYGLMDRVDAFNGSAWRRCRVKEMLTDKSYKVRFVATKEEDVFKHSELRLSLEWEDGVWDETPKKKIEKETPPTDSKKKRLLSEINEMSRPKKLKVIRSCGATLAAVGTCKNIRNSPVHGEGTEVETGAVQESPLNGAVTPVTTTQVIPIEKESAPAETSVIKAVSPDAETQVMTTPKEKLLQPMSVQTAEKTFEEDNNKGISHGSYLKETAEALVYDQPLSALIHGGKSPNDSEHLKLSTPTQITVKNSVPEDETGASEDTTMVLPFVKRSPVWKTLASMEVYKRTKQDPHFTPLLDTREEFREGHAVGEMVNFSNLLERVRTLQLHTPKSTLEGLIECFHKSEKYGFDVAQPVSRINILVSLIDENVSREEKLQEIQKGKAEVVSKVEKVRDDLRDVEGKILELQNQKGELKVEEEAEEKKIADMQMCAEDLDKKSREAELVFQKIVSASW